MVCCNKYRDHNAAASYTNVLPMKLSTAFPACLEQIILDYLVWPFTVDQLVDAQDTVGNPCIDHTRRFITHMVPYIGRCMV